VQVDGTRGANVITETSLLLWEACRRQPDPVAIRRALDRGADLGLAVPASAEHRIGPLLWRALAAADALEELGPLRPGLGGAADAYRMEALLLLPRAVALAVGPLTGAGLEPVVLKGPAVAARYPAPGLRPMDDIDLLLPRSDHARALEALGDAGWRVARPAGPDLYDTALTHADVPSLFLELHYGLEGKSQRVTTLEAEELWRRRRPIDCAGTPAYGLPLAEELVALAAHAGKPHHGFVRVVWIADLAMIVGDAAARGEPIEWERVHDVAVAGRCRTVTGAALALARRVGVDAPKDLFPLPNRGGRGRTVDALLAPTWPLTHADVPGYRLNYALTDSTLRRFKILLVLRASGHGIGRRIRALRHPRRGAASRAAPGI
jgi:hypothetical protein